MASNEEEPMEGIEHGTTLPLPKQSSDSASNEDVAELRVSLSSPHEIEPKKFKSSITKTLQTWANKNSIKGEFTATEISDDGKQAVIRVTPAAALTELLNLSGTELFTKEKKTFSITPITQEDKTQDDTKTSGEFSSLSQREAQHDSVGFSNKDSPADEGNDTCLVALGPYWYMKNFYSDKIQRIEKENGVTITENVAVAIKADKKNANPNKALDKFTKLAQSCLGESVGVSIPLKEVASKDLMETLKFLKATDHKCQITISSDEIKIFGPQQYQVAIQKSLQSSKITNFTDEERMDFHEKGGTRFATNSNDDWKTEFERISDTRKPANAFDKDRKSLDRIKIASNFKDQLVSDGLPIEENYWEAITNLHKRELERIQEKFSVRFSDTDTTRGKRMIKVRYTKSEKNMSMESHAIRALLRLYQKVALSQFRQTNGSFHGREEDLYRAADEANGAAAKTSEKREDKNIKGSAQEGAEKKPRGAEAKEDEKEEDTCPVCMDAFTKKTKLKNCKHEFCEECLERSVKSMGAICPVCKDVFGLVEGDQPKGTMKWHTTNLRLPGFDNCGTIEIHYSIPSGTQTAKHPHPGMPYHGASRTAFLPDNQEGNEVLMLLKKAFDQKLIFTVGMSRTSGTDNMVTWNDIHHKTSMHGGPQGFGYPDPHYLSRVKEELKAKGIK